MSAAMSHQRLLWLLPIAVTGVFTLLASSTFEEDTTSNEATTVDWVLGSLPLPIALATPRGHVRHLLGFEIASGLPQWASFPALAGFSLLAAFVLAWRVPR